jgi:DNA-directed RNA polymerase I and III subunit RPAC1
MATRSYTEAAAVVCGQNELRNEYAQYPEPKDFLSAFKKGFKVVPGAQNSYDHVEFDIVGANAAIANALRRIMISEVETVAIDSVFYRNNTGIMQDEVLAHRLGLLPIRFDPFLLQPSAPGAEATDANTLVFVLDVECTHADLQKAAVEAGGVPEGASLHRSVYASDLKWVPQGNQAERLRGREPRMVHDDVLLTKLAVGQSIRLEVHARRGTGKVHAKWSPAATAAYRMLPDIRILEPIEGALAHELKKRDVTGVFRLEEASDARGGVRAVVSDVRACTMSRECIRENDELAQRIRLARKTDHFIFSVESAGQISAREVFLRAVQVLKGKALTLQKALAEVQGSMEVEGA